MQVKSITIEQQTAEAVQLGVDIDLTNPADSPIRLLRWDYTFVAATAGGARYSGSWEALATIPPKSTVTRRVPVVIPNGGDSAGQAVNEGWNISGSLTYRSPSRLAEIFYDLGLWRPTSGFGGSANLVAQP
jgi:hypothetical protein